MQFLFGFLTAFRFVVEINGLPVGFKSAKGIKIASAFEPLQVGGMNDGPVLLPAASKESGRITFERGKYKSGISRLPPPGMLLDDMAVLLYDEGDMCAAEYILNSPAVESIEVGSLDALSSELAIETLTVVFRSISEKNYL